MEANENPGILQRVRQKICRHDAEWMRKNSLFINLRGETQYKVCKKCGKIMDKRFVGCSQDINENCKYFNRDGSRQCWECEKPRCKKYWCYHETAPET